MRLGHVRLIPYQFDTKGLIVRIQESQLAAVPGKSLQSRDPVRMAYAEAAFPVAETMAPRDVFEMSAVQNWRIVAERIVCWETDQAWVDLQSGADHFRD